MSSKVTEIENRRRYRTTSIFAATLIVFIQIVGALHYHNLPGSRQTAQDQVTAESDSCRVCLIAFHAPAASSPAATPCAPVFEIRTLLSADPLELSQIAFEHHLGRAPPASF